MGEFDFGVSDKEPQRNSSSNNNGSTASVLGLGVKVQTLEAFPSKTTMMMMLHHNHPHRPLSDFDNDSCAGDGDGPTAYMSLNNHINVVSGASSALGAAIDRGGAVAAAAVAAVRPLLQPFDISAYTSSAATTRLAFKSPAGEMAASLGFPFTNAQWKELERQAMIYKYMMASVPIPPDLLIPTSVTAASRSPLVSSFNLRLSSSTDPEPGRCRRTDGKKWRCSRDVAPNHKYCERHMHRGRPRSRKPVEVRTNTDNSNNNHQIKRARHDCHLFPTSAVTVASISNPTIRKDGSSSSQFLASAATQPYLESSLSLDNFGVKNANFDSVASVSSNKEPRGLDWMLKGDPISVGASESEWQPLMHSKVGLTRESSSCNNNTASLSGPKYQEPAYLNSYALYNAGLDQQNRRPPLFLNPLFIPMENLQSEKPRGFIDAWSNAETEENNVNANKSSVVSTIGKLSLSSLDLSMGGGSLNEDMGTVEMGLGLMEPEGNPQNGSKTHLANWLNPAPWVASTPGGPLAEVLRPSTVASTTNEATSNPSSPAITHVESSSPLATVASSPSGVLQKTLASLSDSSSNSSPTVASSKANSEIPLLWFNQK